jgi:hypothetical protein
MSRELFQEDFTMAEVPVSNVKETDGVEYNAYATPNPVFPHLVDNVEIIISAGGQAGRRVYLGEADLARKLYPHVMAKLDDVVFSAASRAQTATIEWSDIHSLTEE